MEISPQTKINELLEEYPYMLDYLTEYSAEFEKLSNPVLRATLSRVASLETAAEMADVPVSRLITDVKTEIDRREGRAPEDAGVGTTSPEPGYTGEVGEERRQEILKGIIRDLHAGAETEEIKNRFAELIQEVEPGEIAAMEQALIAEGMPAEEIQSLCDVHVAVFRSSLDEEPGARRGLPAGHPVDTFLRENREAVELVSSLRCDLDQLRRAEKPARRAALKAITDGLGRLRQIDAHYLRKENQLFPILERHGVAGPTQVMWGIHDEIRALLKTARGAASQGDAETVLQTLPELLQKIEDMIYKEEKILFPVSLEQLSGHEWAQVREGEEEIGYSWLEPANVAHPVLAEEREVGPSSNGDEGPHERRGLLPLTTGAIPLERIDLLLRTLPFDLTYVDEKDQVRYYSEGDRIFPRSPAIIGRNVANCHPPKSVDVVKRIVEEFRSGSKDMAEFWIRLDERFIYIRYFAVRDDAGEYRGVLEVVQDLTAARELEGEHRLLDW